jgi:VIT1/CCC1 family predicted Fe2+/Mn2+ transporter
LASRSSPACSTFSQWDAITALGLAGVLLAAFTVAAAWRAHRRAALAGAVAWGAGAVALTGLVRHASPNSGATEPAVHDP